jgi:uncharacterized protein (DUF433 family)
MASTHSEPSAQQLIDRYIVDHPLLAVPERARIAEVGVSVTALVAYLMGVDWDIDRTAKAYEVPREAVKAAICYYHQHQQAIDARIAHLAST